MPESKAIGFSAAREAMANVTTKMIDTLTALISVRVLNNIETHPDIGNTVVYTLIHFLHADYS